jgi:hypothetical protein
MKRGSSRDRQRRKGISLKPFMIHRKLSKTFWAALGLLGVFCPAVEAFAKEGWGVGVGYHNPVPADLGVSFLYLGDIWAFEAALGAIGVGTGEDDSGVSFGGDIDLKLVVGSKLKLYVQGGLQTGFGASGDGAGLSFGGPFAGAGIMLLGSRLYGQGGADFLLRSEAVSYTATLGLWL